LARERKVSTHRGEKGGRPRKGRERIVPIPPEKRKGHKSRKFVQKKGQHGLEGGSLPDWEKKKKILFREGKGE